jgi:hypothetical protein
MIDLLRYFEGLIRAAAGMPWDWAFGSGLALIAAYTWTTKTAGVTAVSADHVNKLQTEKLDRDGQIPASGVQQWRQGTTVVAAATLELGIGGNSVNVTGTEAITSITQSAVGGAAVQAGTIIRLIFSEAATVVHSAALMLPEGENITTWPGLVLTFIRGSSYWRCTNRALKKEAVSGLRKTDTPEFAGVKITGGTPAAGKVLTSDAGGGGTWQPVSMLKGMIAMFDGDCPAGWTRFSALDGRVPRGGTTYGATGGADTHQHEVNPPATDTGQDFDLTAGGYFDTTAGTLKYHKHNVDIPAFDSAAASSWPPFLTIIFCKKD